MPPYIAGIRLSHNQGVEAIAVSSTLLVLGVTLIRERSLFVKAETEGGKLTAKPTSFIGRIITPIQVFTILAVPASYLAAVLPNSLHQAEWYTNLGGFPIDFDLKAGIGGKAMIRTVTALGALQTLWAQAWVFKTLGKQFHSISPREKAEVVSTGPFTYVRHPMYALAVSQLVLCSAVYWSWIPLLGAGICLGAFVLKIPIEEKLMEDDLALGPQYAVYKKKVPYRLIPYIW